MVELSPGYIITVSGARTRNLKNITLRIPIGQITLITGPGGSGKTSFAIHTLHSKCLSAFFRLNLDEPLWTIRRYDGFMETVEVDYVEPFMPCAALYQFPSKHLLTHTIGKYTGLDELLAEVFYTYGTLRCPTCATEIDAFPTPESIAQQILSLTEGTRFYLLADLGTFPHARLNPLAAELLQRGYVRVRIDERVYELEEITRVPRKTNHKVSVVIDRLVVSKEYASRIEESLRTALDLGKTGRIVVLTTKGKQFFFSREPLCITCGKIYERPTRDIFLNPQNSTESKNQADIRCHVATFQELWNGSFNNLISWCKSLPLSISKAFSIRRIIEITKAIEKLGIEYLSPDRKLYYISSGELQKLRLLRLTLHPFTGLLYILDEPSRGLDNQGQRFLSTFVQKIKKSGSTVVVLDTIHELHNIADYFIELGPGKGPEGGFVRYEGPANDYNIQVRANRHLSEKTIKAITPKLNIDTVPWIRISEIYYRNLQDISVSVPTDAITYITGPIGSGKTSLARLIMRGIVKNSSEREIPKISKPPYITKAYFIGDVPRVYESRSTVVNFLNVFGLIRRFFASLPKARRYGFSPRHFSYVLDGQCPRCRGSGASTFSGQKQLYEFEFAPCPLCRGKRYRAEVLRVKYKGFSVADVLNLSVVEARNIFSFLPALSRPLSLLWQIGLGHIRLGQPLACLSGSELKLLLVVRHVVILTSPTRTETKSLCIFDYPTSGLHESDLEELINMWKLLREVRHTLILCDTTSKLFDICDWLIALGPGSGPSGGKILYQGHPSSFPHDRL